MREKEKAIAPIKEDKKQKFTTLDIVVDDAEVKRAMKN